MTVGGYGPTIFSIFIGGSTLSFCTRAQNTQLLQASFKKIDTFVIVRASASQSGWS